MDILDEIKNSLATNENLTEEIRAKVFELVIIFHHKFPTISLDKLKERVKSVKLGRIGVFERRGSMVYDTLKNEIAFSNKKLRDEYDANHLMMKGVIAMIAASDEYYGFNEDNRLVALNVGFTEMLANFLVGNEGICDYEEELLATNLVSEIVGRDILLDAYFNNDSELVYRKLLEAEVG